MAHKVPCFKDVHLAPLDGGMDLRTPSGLVSDHGFRISLNMTLTEQKKLCRLGGWTKLFSEGQFGFLNQDLHDQLTKCQYYYTTYEGKFSSAGGLTGFEYPYFQPDVYTGYGIIPGYFFGIPTGVYTQPDSYDFTYCGNYLFNRSGCREPISMLSEITTEGGSRKLIAATKHRVNELNERTANYRIIADGLGGGLRTQEDCVDCPERRFKSAAVGAVMVLTNNFDPPLYYAFDSKTEDCALWAAKYISDLVLLGITKAAVVASWQGFIFLANVEQENNYHPTRIFWSDINNPTSWSPNTESAAGYTDLGIGEKILAMHHLGVSMMVYTDQAIYKGSLVGGDLVWAFHEMYRGGDSLRFPNSLVPVGNAHIYCSESGIFVLGKYDHTPVRVEWIHHASAAIFKGVPQDYLKSFAGLLAFGPVNIAACDRLVGGYDEVEKDVWFSWPTDKNTCQNMSLKLNLTYYSSTLVDHGFSAFLSYKSDARPTVGDFLREWQICLYSQFGSDLIKEGEPYSVGVTSFPNPPSYIFNATEDTSLPSHPDSLCARLGALSLDDLCEPCALGTVFVMADAQDRTLKEFRKDLQYRERYIGSTTSLPCPHTVAGTYALDGYYSMLQSDAQGFGLDAEKLIDRLKIDFVSEAQAYPNSLYAQIAYGAQPGCLTWESPQTNDLRCLTNFTDGDHESNNTRSYEGASYQVYRRGRYLAWRFYVNGTGGGACFNNLTQRVRPVQGEWK